MFKTIFEKSVPGRCAVLPAPLDVPEAVLPEALRRNTPLALPEMSELDVIRHFTRLSQRNYGVDAQFYPLGSCTMKYNPKVAETVAALPGFAGLHPHLASDAAYLEDCQGALELVYEMERLLAEIGGMKAGCLQPMAGAHGELTGVLLIAEMTGSFAYMLPLGIVCLGAYLTAEAVHCTPIYESLLELLPNLRAKRG